MAASHHHTSVLYDAAIDALAVRPDGVYIDGTFGRGGHTAGLLEQLGPAGRVIAFDKDLAACQAGWSRFGADGRLTLVHAGFETLGQWVRDAGLMGHVDGLLLDLGVSSPQLDNAERGFSFMRAGPLDMRMDATAGETAADWLARADAREIADVLWRYGDERQSRRIAAAIVRQRDAEPLTTTTQLAQLIESIVRRTPGGSHPATRSFQAIRMHINGEMAALEAVLDQAMEVLADGGRLAVISFHSLEDRIVKRFMRGYAQPPLPPVPAAPRPPAELDIVLRKLRPGPDEVATNPRARSATLRAAERRRRR
ncbi:16S rRNA (cytosine(1402)-N(4))-methyltransferase RsmH [Abyssibacter profundi]|uniref:Ribosomal RNA small subunit methyltransferase H n=1 Tax=Abyssibacter profundi TaxID=2182787 RepID=A0A363UMD7_9GAMM|nr:16S rRNA (cytosine(1402)-N(4))-methyltransferase RsmH [Abyssibacter profundi]PWN56554.1 16S rRNA (cytosine(1402)-N(4))-methyltransferase RsmH [Abyssibacter profundi]